MEGQPLLPDSGEEQNVTTITVRLRIKMRQYSMCIREAYRSNTVDALRFGLNEVNDEIEDLEDLTEKDVISLAKRIKRRKHATEEDMYRLSHAFLQGNDNIKAFVQIQGAIEVLIKELTGKRFMRHLFAAECFCNLSLGEAPVCEKIANMAGSYFVTYLDTKELQVKMLSLWTIANIIATSIKAGRMLLQMKILPKLWRIFTDEESIIDNNIDSREDAGLCLRLITMQKQLELGDEDRKFIKNNLHCKNPTTSGAEYHLQIIFNCDILDSDITDEQIIYLINFSLRNIKEAKELENTSNKLRVIYALRVLGNLLASKESTWQLFLQQLSCVWRDNLSNIMNQLFGHNEQALSYEALWLLKQIIACDKKHNTGMKTTLLETVRVCRTLPPFKVNPNVIISQ